jgi:hypothetical protein
MKVYYHRDAINEISKKWSIIYNEVDIRNDYKYQYGSFSTLKEVSRSNHRLEFWISDSKEMDGDLPMDIADDIIEYVTTKLHDSIVYSDNSGKTLKLAKNKDLRNGYVKFFIYI